MEGGEIGRDGHQILNRQTQTGRQRREHVGEGGRERLYRQRRYAKVIWKAILKQGQPILVGLKWVVEDAVVGPDYSLLLLAQTPGDSDPRCDVVPIHSETLRKRKWRASIGIWR